MRMAMRMTMLRRAWLLSLAMAAAAPLRAAATQGVSRRPLRFPRDHGAHEETALEWWYLTGLLGKSRGAAPQYGYQLTFFRLRHRDPAVQALTSALAPRQLLLGHIALSDLRRGCLLHQQRLARVGLGAMAARFSRSDCGLRLGDWQLERSALGPAGSRYRASFGGGSAGFALSLDLHSEQAPLLQGENGYSRKGPLEAEASHYYSQPQLQGKARLSLAGETLRLDGSAWLDHEWMDALMPPGAVGWDWAGINLLDGGALTLARMRRADGSTLWSGGSWQRSDGSQRNLAHGELRFEPGRRWTSPQTQARYPVEWRLLSPADVLGPLRLQALLDSQEVDGRAASGLAYWEGAVALLDGEDRLLGRGYLEMTGYAAPMRL